MNNKEELSLNCILDTLQRKVESINYSSCEVGLKYSQIVKDLSEAYLNITEASCKRGFNT